MGNIAKIVLPALLVVVIVLGFYFYKMGWCVSCHEANAKDEKELALLKDCFTYHY
jgi:hypothetical protein